MRRSGTPLLVLVMMPLLSVHAAGLRGAREGRYRLGSREQPAPERLVSVDIALDTQPRQLLPDVDTISKGLSMDSSELLNSLATTINMRLPPAVRGVAGLLPILPRLQTDCRCGQQGGNRSCSCCATLSSMFDMRNRNGCINIGYDPERVAVRANLTLNNKTIIDRELFSGANPPAICIPVPQFPIVNVCVRLYNINLKDDRELQVCVALEAGLTFAQSLLRVRVGCLHSGADGISWQPAPSNADTNDNERLVMRPMNTHEAPSNADIDDKERLVMPPFKTHEESEFDAQPWRLTSRLYRW